MEAVEYLNIYQNEETHFYYRSVHELVLSLLRKYSDGSPKSLLDAGCGTGHLTRQLKDFGTVEAIDISALACELSQKRGIAAQKASVTQIPFANETFDVVVSIDLLYHKQIESDRQAISEIFRVLKPGGLLILRVPALPWLRSEHDRHVHTRERYAKESLARKLAAPGFVIEKLTYIGMSLLPIALLKHLFHDHTSTQTQSGVQSLPKFLNKVLYFILSLENRLVHKVDFPLGIGLLAIGKKK